ncbi:MAG: hypothetical protein OEU26_32710, partial [Candidatus Tectomicrobia bacterium]|nr:hypothetical protein [Candidatus Tectomicrobia bacterium]
MARAGLLIQWLIISALFLWAAGQTGVAANDRDELEAPLRPPLERLFQALESLAELVPNEAEGLKGLATAADEALRLGNTEQAAVELSELVQLATTLPREDTLDLAVLDLVIAVEKDLDRMTATVDNPDITTSDRQWNMRCIRGSNNCEVKRGC